MNDEPQPTTTPTVASSEEPVSIAAASISSRGNGIVMKDQPAISSEPITGGSLPDENIICRTVGLVSSLKYCNVYYSCKQYGQPPVEAFYCSESAYFDQSKKVCRMASNLPGGQCALNPPLMYPYVSLAEIIPPEEFACSNQVGAYIIHSNVYCNIYYSCDGR